MWLPAWTPVTCHRPIAAGLRHACWQQQVGSGLQGTPHHCIAGLLSAAGRGRVPGHTPAAPDDVQVVHPSARSLAVVQAGAVMSSHLPADWSPASSFQLMCPSVRPPAALRLLQAGAVTLVPVLAAPCRNECPSLMPTTVLLSAPGKGSDARSDPRQSPPPGDNRCSPSPAGTCR